ncbi:MAG: hypothetical protein R6V55_15035, partial [Desulfovermiculus sp.]
MSQLASVITQPASTSKGLPKSSQSGQGQSMAGSSSPFARYLTTAGESPSQASSSQFGPAQADSRPLGQTPILSESDQAEQVIQALVNMLQEKPQAGQMLQEAMETGELQSSFMGRLLAALQQSGADGTQMSSLQMAEEPSTQSQHGFEGHKQVDIAGSDLLSALLSQTELQAQFGSQSIDSEARTELGQLLEQVQAMLGNGKGQVQTAQAEMGSQTLDPGARAELGEILQRMQALLSGGKGQVQNAQSVQDGSQSLDSETRAELRQLLQRMQAVLGQSESKGQAGNGQKA